MTLSAICENAAKAGRDIDLSGCDYGPHKRSGLHLGPQPYYYLLAGFTQTLGLRKILEIGTSYGGSMMAISRGCGRDLSAVELVTVDKVNIAGEGLMALLHVKRVHGDSLSPATLRSVRNQLSPPISLLYIDSKHSYEHTQKNLDLYCAEFSPRFVILDDIHLNPEMDRLWSELSQRFGGDAFDASELAGRPSGFGILDCGRASPNLNAV